LGNPQIPYRQHRHAMLAAKVGEREHIKDTKSLCPECKAVVPAVVYAEGGKVWIEKECPAHGRFKDVYWSDYELYKKVLKYDYIGSKLENPRTQATRECPYNCGICDMHKTYTVLGIVDVTNRCNLNCPICFAHAGAVGYVYEPTKEQIRAMLENLRANRPVPTPALQFSGGEPTVREDLPELVKMARELGFRHIEVNTNGIMLAKSLDYCRELVEAGADTFYLQFDGTKPKAYEAARGRDLLPIKKKALEHLRKAGCHSVVLVPTLVRGVNDDQIGEIIEFAYKNRDIVRCVNFQPVSITGRIDYSKREQMRITIPDLMHLAEEQTKGRIKVDDWYPVPTVVPIAKFAAKALGRGFPEFSAHPHCGMATYILPTWRGYKPITAFADVDELISAIDAAVGLENKDAMIKALKQAAKKHVSKWFLFRHFLPVALKGDYDALRRLHYKMIMIGSMHFMDPYNFDVDRVQRCIIHYATPDGRIIPFCSYNSIHRPEVERKFSVPLEKWRGEKA